MRIALVICTWVLLLALPCPARADAPEKKTPVKNILELPRSGTDPEKIDYARLPKIAGTHAIVCPVALGPEAAGKEKIDLRDLRLQLHNYLVHHDGRFWCIWSDGPRIEDEPTQEVRYSTSVDGIHWSPAKSVTGTPAAPYAFIARGLWVREGELLALAAHFKNKGAFGADKELELWAYAWDEKSGKWQLKGTVYENAINNFPPQRLADGQWIMSRRDARFNVSMLIGGREALGDWQAFPVVGISQTPGFRPDEPIFWQAGGQRLAALFRDNGGSRRLFYAESDDAGRTWTDPAITNFPNSTSKLFSLKTSRGDRLLVLNAHPQLGRRELHLAISRDGRTFTRLAMLDIPSFPAERFIGPTTLHKKFAYGIASLQYPHAIEHAGHIYVAFSRNKLQTELFRVPLASMEALFDQ